MNSILGWIRWFKIDRRTDRNGYVTVCVVDATRATHKAVGERVKYCSKSGISLYPVVEGKVRWSWKVKPWHKYTRHTLSFVLQRKEHRRVDTLEAQKPRHKSCPYSHKRCLLYPRSGFDLSSISTTKKSSQVASDPLSRVCFDHQDKMWMLKTASACCGQFQKIQIMCGYVQGC